MSQILISQAMFMSSLNQRLPPKTGLQRQGLGMSANALACDGYCWYRKTASLIFSTLDPNITNFTVKRELRGWGCGKHKALSSNPSTAKRKKTKTK
jgi:hypothetical protein